MNPGKEFTIRWNQCEADGMRLKWIVEMCDESQKAKYDQLVWYCEDEELYYTENLLLKFLDARLWDVDGALVSLWERHEFFTEKGYYEELDPEDFPVLMEW